MTKVPLHLPRYTQSRSYHLIDFNTLNFQIMNDPLIPQILNEHQPDTITTMASDLIISHLEEKNAPLKLIQSSKKIPNYLTPDTRELICLRDQTWTTYTQTSCQETLREHKHIKARVIKAIKADRMEDQKRQNYEAISSKDKWKKCEATARLDKAQWTQNVN